MSITHSHQIVVRDYHDDEIDSSHLDSTGRAYGHDEHKRAKGTEHTHEDVREVVHPWTGDVLHLPLADEDEQSSEETPAIRTIQAKDVTNEKQENS